VKQRRRRALLWRVRRYDGYSPDTNTMFFILATTTETFHR
jgi:hypothetical protein